MLAQGLTINHHNGGGIVRPKGGTNETRRGLLTNVTMVRILGVDYPLRGWADSQIVRAAMRAAGINRASLYRNGVWLEFDLVLLRDGGLEAREAREWPKGE